MSQKMHHYFTACFVVLLIIHNCNSPFVEAGPVTYTACVLACCGTVCSSVAAGCGILGALTGPSAVLAAAGCLAAAGGGCSYCVATCTSAGLLPTV